MKKIFNASFIYLVLGLILGVFYREFTKLNGFEGETVLTALHSHVLVLGFIFFLIVLVIDKLFSISSQKNFNKWFILYNISLVSLIITFLIRGILQVNGSDMAGLSHMAGTSHALLGLSMVWFMVIVRKVVVNYDNKKELGI